MSYPARAEGLANSTFQKNSISNFIHELNKNNKISFLDVPIDDNNNNDNYNFITSIYKIPHRKQLLYPQL